MTAALQWTMDGRDWPNREASRFVDIGAMRWHVQCLGQGPTLLMLHGAGGSTHSWRDLLPLLGAHFRVVAPDLPGHGFSAPLPAAQRSLPGTARAIAELLCALPARPRAVLGHSAGGALMTRMALDGLLEGATLIGLNAALLPFEGWASFLYPTMARVLARQPWVASLAAWRARDPAAVRRLVAATGSRLDEGGVALYQRLMRSPGHVAGVLAMMADWDLHALQRDLDRLGPALHLIVGAQDGIVPPAQADRIAARLARGCADRSARGCVHRLAGLGHLAHEEAPKAVAERVLALARARAAD
jgi:magnesium chelatase accessory protein